MKKTELFQAVGEIDNDLLADAENFLNNTTTVRRKSNPWMKWGGLAACAAVAACALWAMSPGEEPGQLQLDTTPPANFQQDTTPSPEIVQSTPNTDRPAVEPEEVTRPIVQMNFNQLDGEPERGVTAMFALLGEDFVPMTREELLDYYGVSLPAEAFPSSYPAINLGEDGFDGGVYRSESRGAYFDANTFAFGSEDGALGVYVTLDKAFHMPAASWELPGDGLEFTEIDGWELALFRYPDEEGNQYFYTEFLQNGVGYRVQGKNMCEQEFAVVLEALLEERSDRAPGEARTFVGEYTGGIGRLARTSTNPDGSVAVVETWWDGILGLRLEEGAEYAQLQIDLTPEQAEAFSDLALGDRVEVTFTGEPATVGTVWQQQLVCLKRAE